MNLSELLGQLLYRAARRFRKPFDRSESERLAAELLERQSAERRNYPNFTCPRCGGHSWGTGRVQDDGTAFGGCESDNDGSCRFSWLRPHQDSDVGLGRSSYDLAAAIRNLPARREAERAQLAWLTKNAGRRLPWPPQND